MASSENECNVIWQEIKKQQGILLALSAALIAKENIDQYIDELYKSYAILLANKTALDRLKEKYIVFQQSKKEQHGASDQPKIQAFGLWIKHTENCFERLLLRPAISQEQLQRMADLMNHLIGTDPVIPRLLDRFQSKGTKSLKIEDDEDEETEASFQADFEQKEQSMHEEMRNDFYSRKQEGSKNPSNLHKAPDRKDREDETDEEDLSPNFALNACTKLCFMGGMGLFVVGFVLLSVAVSSLVATGFIFAPGSLVVGGAGVLAVTAGLGLMKAGSSRFFNDPSQKMPRVWELMSCVPGLGKCF